MRHDYQRQILSLLLDWYEDSPAYIRGENPSRRRMMRLYDGGKTDFPSYDIEDPLIRKDVNQAVLDLAEQGLVGYEWMRGQQNHILAKLWLDPGAVRQAYAHIGRRPKGDEAEDLLLRLNALLGRTQAEWSRRWLEDTIAVIARKRAVGAVMPGTPQEQDDLLKAVSVLADSAEIETLERVFSMRCFGDSKHFERTVKARLARVLRKYLAQDDCTDDEALRLAGLVPYPEQFAFSGALKITLPRGVVDFSPLPFGGTLTIDDIRQGQISFSDHVRRILSVENYANYVDYVHKHKEKDEFVFFHGGQYSPAKRMFLEAIVSSLPDDGAFFHWGDIDFGGFRMLARLRREILPGVRPWRMNLDELAHFAEFTVGFPEAYQKRLISLLDMPELADCYPCIEYMIKSGVRLEQEAMLVESSGPYHHRDQYDRLLIATAIAENRGIPNA